MGISSFGFSTKISIMYDESNFRSNNMMWEYICDGEKMIINLCFAETMK